MTFGHEIARDVRPQNDVYLKPFHGSEEAPGKVDEVDGKSEKGGGARW